ncbi:unnamed protein product [Microthlaspi erraticum]|uniref:Uncharacterized protein n=1 Tax=Microthlaspi erraticum TaxID=1685480 RepID=A0A6D2IGY3_9BRAS|nr:unnamed protein product [Microthlaspi erraticum]
MVPPIHPPPWIRREIEANVLHPHTTQISLKSPPLNSEIYLFAEFAGGGELITKIQDGAVDNDNNNKDVFTAVDQAEITKDVCLMYDFVNQHLQEATRVSDLSLEEDDVLKLVSEKSENRVVRNIKASMKCSDREVSKPATESFSFRIPPSENIESQGRSDLPGIDVLVSAAKRKSRLWSQPTVRLMLR